MIRDTHSLSILKIKKMFLVPLQSLATPVHGSICIFEKFLVLKAREVTKEKSAAAAADVSPRVAGSDVILTCVDGWLRRQRPVVRSHRAIGRWESPAEVARPKRP